MILLALTSFLLNMAVAANSKLCESEDAPPNISVETFVPNLEPYFMVSCPCQRTGDCAELFVFAKDATNKPYVALSASGIRMHSLILGPLRTKRIILFTSAYDENNRRIRHDKDTLSLVEGQFRNKHNVAQGLPPNSPATLSLSSAARHQFAAFSTWESARSISSPSPASPSHSLRDAHSAALSVYKAGNPDSAIAILRKALGKSWIVSAENLAPINDLGFFLEQSSRVNEALPYLEPLSNIRHNERQHFSTWQMPI